MFNVYDLNQEAQFNGWSYEEDIAAFNAMRLVYNRVAGKPGRK